MLLLFGLTWCLFFFIGGTSPFGAVSFRVFFFQFAWLGQYIYFLTCRGNFRTIWHYRFNNLSIFILFGFLWERNPHCRKLLIDFFATVDLLLFLTTHVFMMNCFMPLMSSLFLKWASDTSVAWTLSANMSGFVNRDFVTRYCIDNVSRFDTVI